MWNPQGSSPGSHKELALACKMEQLVQLSHQIQPAKRQSLSQALPWGQILWLWGLCPEVWLVCFVESLRLEKTSGINESHM